MVELRGWQWKKSLGIWIQKGLLIKGLYFTAIAYILSILYILVDIVFTWMNK